MVSASIAVKLKEIMEEKNITANALEKRSGVKVSSVQNIIYGRSKNPGIDTVKAIAKALGCTLYDLLDPADESSQHSHIQNPSDQEWDISLFIDALKAIETMMKQKNIKPSYKTVLTFANEIYSYSQVSNKKTVDYDFTRWLFEKHTEK
ncbi:MAG: helix-turn-helix transcriptional regulator [Alphaproteobacteria bacterium]|nr:helix-turn-helix transcriptional regulator [Alphaproteobacteria bacterium]